MHQSVCISMYFLKLQCFCFGGNPDVTCCVSSSPPLRFSSSILSSIHHPLQPLSTLISLPSIFSLWRRGQEVTQHALRQSCWRSTVAKKTLIAVFKLLRLQLVLNRNKIISFDFWIWSWSFLRQTDQFCVWTMWHCLITASGLLTVIVQCCRSS